MLGDKANLCRLDSQLARKEDIEWEEEQRRLELLRVEKRERKLGITKAPIKPETYLWNVPKCRRKEYLRSKLSLKLFIAIFGR